MSKLYKSFTAAPYTVCDMNGKILNLHTVLHELALDVQDISGEADFVVRNDETLLADVDVLSHIKQPNTVGRLLGLTPCDQKARGTGESRRAMLFQHQVVSSARSWLERVKASDGSSDKFISQGWKRTAHSQKPGYGDNFINLGAVDSQYVRVNIENSSLDLTLVVNRRWVIFSFVFDKERFKGYTKVCSPIVALKNGQPVFHFPVEFPSVMSKFSQEYIIGVDVGKVQYATVTVYNTETQSITYSTTLSQRVHSLWNSIQASERQVRFLKKKARKYPLNRTLVMNYLNEATLHRSKNVRKKRELAILAGQEVAELSVLFDNAPVVFEDLSWIRNTMQNGRWNKGALVDWTSHYVAQNGGWVLTTSAYKTSQLCYVCRQPGRIDQKHRTFVCKEHGAFDRDVNAGANIAQNAESAIIKARTTRKKSKKLQTVQQRTPITRPSLKYPGRDRTKHQPTPCQPQKRKSSSLTLRKEVTSPTPTTRNMATVVVDNVVSACTDIGTFMAGEIFMYRDPI